MLLTKTMDEVDTRLSTSFGKKQHGEWLSLLFGGVRVCRHEGSLPILVEPASWLLTIIYPGVYILCQGKSTGDKTPYFMIIFI